jgi:OmcA/MtrC family decaheme c-type cytochrome
MSRANETRELRRAGARASAAGALFASALLAACSGTTGSAGPAGPAGATGPQGPTTTGSAINISTATAITGKITSVAISGPPVVKFELTDQNGAPIQGLPAADLGFAIAQNGASSQWNSYIYSSVTPAGCPSGVAACDATPKTQASVESATSGTFVDNGDGSYQYTFKTDITKVPNVVYDASLTHRVGFEIRGLAQANNAAYTFQPSTGATTGIFSREIVDTATCDNCHTLLSEHGGARVEVQYCVMCHNPGTTDPYSGNSLDMKVMVHKIHTGSSLPSIQTASGTNTTPTLGQGYWIVGYMKSLNNFNTVVFPQDTRNCTTCHVQTHPNLTQAANYMSVPNMEACGACHDNVNFATGANHSSANIVANDTQCTTCHGPTSTIDNSQLQVVAAHVIPEMVFQKQISYNIIKASNTAPGQKPVIQFSVTDPTNGNKPWNLVTDEPFAYCTNPNFGMANLNLAIAWSTTDYTNVGSGVTSEAAEPISLPVTCAATPPTANGDGTYTVTSPTAIPANIKGSAGILFEGHPAHDFKDGTGAQEIPVPNAVSYAPITDSVAVPRREVAAVANCNTCHYQLNGHGNNRVDSVQACSFCHNPNATDVVARIAAGVTPANPDPTDHLAEQSMDLKVMIHAIHAGAVRAADLGTPYLLYHNGSVHNFSTLGFSGLTNNCLACHDANTYYPPDPTSSTVLASTVSTYVNGVGNSGPAGQTAVTAATAACSACHQSVTEKTHMTQNGGNFTAVKDANSHVVSTETCVICHGPGAVADVKLVHNLALYQ